ncbi:MAG: NAD(P)H-dependent oxidoreductase [Candidatus Pacebacteria bacterium]|nr:NAD(P)H-dependent oxidoreductase [Candidatus Paceibacterota bacterium]MDR3583477.1 NAD(P)H-dependent oxidoreductase [Candidatus Paceibacterota bacterium]
MENEKKMKIVGLVGSLRKDSFNRILMAEAVKLCPAEAEIEILGIELPPFNQDRETDLPKEVKKFKEKIRSADAILIATAEYNYSIPGVLKNAIDWASRPYGDNSLEGKPVAVMSASIGMLGGARAQYHLRQVFVFLDMHPVNRPEVMVSFAAEKIQGGVLQDETTKEKVNELLQALIAWAKRLGNNKG